MNSSCETPSAAVPDGAISTETGAFICLAAIFTIDDAQQSVARRSLSNYEQELVEAGYGPITTEILPLDAYFYAEDYHQQYLAKNPGGYCGLGGTGVSCPVGLDLDKKSA